MRKFPDFQRLAAKFAAKRANLQDAFRVFVAFEKLSPAVESLQSYAGDAQPALQDNFIKDLQESQRDLENFYRMVETTIDLEEVKRGNFLIKPSFDENLQELREMLDDIEGKLQECKNRCKGLDLGDIMNCSLGPLLILALQVLSWRSLLLSEGSTSGSHSRREVAFPRTRTIL